jgi:hypothetical protein
MRAGNRVSIDLGVVRWVNRRHAGIEFIRMSNEDQGCLRWQVGFQGPRHTSRAAWTEPIVWTGISGV